MSGLECILIGANIGAGAVGFILSNIITRIFNKREHQKNKKRHEDIINQLTKMNDLVNPQIPTESSTPVESDDIPYGNENENLYELKPYYNSQTKCTEFRYVQTPRP